jgi:hypothetical protein
LCAGHVPALRVHQVTCLHGQAIGTPQEVSWGLGVDGEWRSGRSGGVEEEEYGTLALPHELIHGGMEALSRTHSCADSAWHVESGAASYADSAWHVV